MKRLHIVVLLAVSLAVGGCANPQKKQEELTEEASYHYKMAAGYFEAQEIALAIREATRALELDPDHREANYLMGFIYQGRRDYGKAVKHYNRVLQNDPSYHFARNNLGTVYLEMERWADAREQFQALLEEPLYPTPELAHNNLGWALYQKGEYNEAVRHFEMASFLKPQMCLAHNNKGLALRETGKHNEAMESFSEALRLCPDRYAEPHFHMGKYLVEAGNPKARRHFEACVRIEPGSKLGRRCREYLSVR